MNRRALIIDDEATARADLRAKLAAHPEIRIVGEAATLRAAGELLARDDYDLVFLDILLIGGISFELVPEIRPGARVIFATAHDEFAVRAFEINALDYLLKPVEPARLAEALSRLAVPPAGPGAEAVATDRLRPDDVVYLDAGQRARFVPVGEISMISAADNYSEVLLAGGETLLLRKPLRAWEAVLPEPRFFRVHRTRLLNLHRVTRYERDRDEHTLLWVEGLNGPVTASRERWPDLRARFATLRRAT